MWNVNSPTSHMKVCTTSVLLRGENILLVLADLNKLKVWGNDLGSTYIEALFEESLLHFRHSMVTFKDKHGVQTSGLWA